MHFPTKVTYLSPISHVAIKSLTSHTTIETSQSASCPQTTEPYKVDQLMRPVITQQRKNKKKKKRVVRKKRRVRCVRLPLQWWCLLGLASAWLGLNLAQRDLDWQRWCLLVNRRLDLDLFGWVVDEQVVEVSADTHFVV